MLVNHNLNRFGALLTSKLDVMESKFDRLALLTIMCNLSSLVPFMFLGLLDDVDDITTSKMDDDLHAKRAVTLGVTSAS